MGHDSDARHIRIERQRQRRRHGQLGKHQRVWSWLLDITIRYGWEPWRALAGLVAVWALGAVVFAWAAHVGVMTRIDEASLTALQPVIYSLDSLLPFVDLQQQRYWLPATSVDGGWPVMVYLWLHISFGWVLSTLTVIAFSGLVRQP